MTVRLQRRTIGDAEGHHQVELCPSFNDKVWTLLVFLKGAGFFHSADQSIQEGNLVLAPEHLIFMKLLPDLWH